MTKLVELSNQTHNKIRIHPNASVKFAAQQHVMKVQAAELGNAATCFPLFATKNAQNGFWMFSAMTSFEMHNNLYVKDGRWLPHFQPMSMHTHPIYLMKSPHADTQYTFGILPESEAFSSDKGELLFDDKGQPTPRLKRITELLDNSVKLDLQSAEFSRVIEDMGLFKAIDMNISFNGEHQPERIKGLHTIDEEAFQKLSLDQLDTLRKQGYLMPIHAMLMSIYNINGLINRHNERHPMQSILRIKMDKLVD